MALTRREVIGGLIAVPLLVAGGSYVGSQLIGNKNSDKPVKEVKRGAYSQSSQSGADSIDRALADGRLALRDLDGDSKRELIYFPLGGPPAVYTQIGNEYTSSNPISAQLYRDATRFGAILASDYSIMTRRALLGELERSVRPSMYPLVGYAGLYDPSIVMLCDGGDRRMISASAAASLMAELYNADRAADLLNPKTIAVGLVTLGVTMLDRGKFVYVAPPSYGYWAGMGWPVDNNGMVHVTPGCSVHITDTATLNMYNDFRNDPRMILTGGGLVQLERVPSNRPEALETFDTFKRKEIQFRQQAATQQAYQQWSQQTGENIRQVQHQFDAFNRDMGNRAQQFQQSFNNQMNTWNQQVNNIFRRR